MKERKEKEGCQRLPLVEKAAQLVHHTTTLVGGGATLGTTVPAGVVRGTLLLALVLVLLDSVLRNAAHDSTTDGPEDTVVGLVAREATGETAGKGSTESTLALLGTAGSLLLVTSGE